MTDSATSSESEEDSETWEVHGSADIGLSNTIDIDPNQEDKPDEEACIEAPLEDLETMSDHQLREHLGRTLSVSGADPVESSQ